MTKCLYCMEREPESGLYCSFCLYLKPELAEKSQTHAQPAPAGPVVTSKPEAEPDQMQRFYSQPPRKAVEREIIRERFKLPRWVVGAAVILVIANVVLAGLAANHLRFLNDLDTGQDRLNSQLEDLQSDVEQLRLRGSAIERDVAGLKGRPEVNVAAVTSSLAQLSSEIDSLESAIDSVEFEIRRPFGCRPGDFVVWGSLFNGFTC